MTPLLKFLIRHKGKTLTGTALLAALLIFTSRGCRFTVEIDPVHARTNVSAVQSAPTVATNETLRP